MKNEMMKLKFFDAADYQPKKQKMKIEFFTTGKIEQGYCLIGKTGNFRFKQLLAEQMKFVKGERWLIGVDSRSDPNFVYFIRASQDQLMNGFKMTFQNKSWSLAAKTVVKELGLQIPLKCRIEQFSNEKYSGLKLILPKPSPPHDPPNI